MPDITEAQLERLTKLRAEVPAHLIGKLPRVTCGDCSNRNRQCDKHAKTRCTVCGAYVSSAHIHLDYVGHAETTSILLDADPMWFWEPLALAPDGLPQFDAGGGLWIRLTVCGVTRLGYGTADNGAGRKASGDVIKEVIGDAIRNAAMRFGVALDLWAKTDLHADEEAAAEAGRPASGQQRPQGSNQQRQQNGGNAQYSKPTQPKDDEFTIAPDAGRAAGWSANDRAHLVTNLVDEMWKAQTPEQLGAVAQRVADAQAAGKLLAADREPLGEAYRKRMGELRPAPADAAPPPAAPEQPPAAPAPPPKWTEQDREQLLADTYADMAAALNPEELGTIAARVVDAYNAGKILLKDKNALEKDYARLMRTLRGSGVNA